MFDWTQAVTTATILSALVSLICRIGHMHQGATHPRVFAQHLALVAGLVFALALPPKYALTPLVLGISVFLSLGAYRWRGGAPEDTKTQKGIVS